MNKLMKKLMAGIAAITMVLAMGITAFAAEPRIGDITVNKAIKNAVYTAYKVFDVTYSGTDNSNVSYTLMDNIDYAQISGFTNTFDTYTNGGLTYVTAKTGKTGEDVAQVFTKEILETKFSVADSVTNTDGAQSVTLKTGYAGYYVIVSSVGGKNALTIDTAHPTASVDSKVDSTPTIPEDGGKKINGKTVTTMQVGDSAPFTLTFNATNYKVENKQSTPINEYTVTDTANGFDLNNLTDFSVTVNGEAYSITGKEISHKVEFSTDGLQTLTVRIPWDQTTYPSPSTVVISYKAKLTNKNIAKDSTNSFTVDQIPGKNPIIHTYNYQINITKTDEATNKALSGAKFVLVKKDENNKITSYYKKDTGTGAVSWVNAKTDATEVTTDDNGNANFSGLAAGKYYLVETEAPDGYNLAADKEVELSEIDSALSDTASLTVNSSVKDKAGATLPSTGGMGTTIFYALGAALAIGAGVILVTRKRLSK